MLANKRWYLISFNYIKIKNIIYFPYKFRTKFTRFNQNHSYILENIMPFCFIYRDEVLLNLAHLIF
jgi:hypothetical protein